MKKMLMITALLFAAGCKSETGEVDVGRTALGVFSFGLSEINSPERLRERDKVTCKSFGYVGGTAEFRECALSLYKTRLSSPVVMGGYGESKKLDEIQRCQKNQQMGLLC